MNSETVVSLKNVTKSFKIPLDKADGIKQVVVRLAKRKKGYRDFKVLDNVSFDIKKGEFFGIVGRNGSGKSTLLKLIAQIYTANEGSVDVVGSLTPFIELGVGFNPELTGKENVFLNGALLGFSKKEMDDMYDEIVEFSELQDFMGERLKNYSSGMQVRLAFAIAVRARSDILLIDEVLAVGDSAFQQKCFDYFDQLKREKRTIIFISHDMSAVKRYCDRCVLVENGKITKNGSPTQIAKLYDNLNLDSIAKTSEKLEKKEKPSQLIKAKTLNSDMNAENKFSYGDQVNVTIEWKDALAVENVGVTLSKDNQYIYGTNTFKNSRISIESGKVVFNLKLNLGHGKYRLGIGLFGKTEQDAVTYLAEGPEIIIKEGDDTSWGGLIKLDSSWINREVK